MTYLLKSGTKVFRVKAENIEAAMKRLRVEHPELTNEKVTVVQTGCPLTKGLQGFPVRG